MLGDNPAENPQGKGQANRLSIQHLENGGVVGIFGQDAQIHEAELRTVTEKIYNELSKSISHLNFRFRRTITKKEIHKKLNSVDSALGTTLFVDSASIQPDGGIIEVKDKNNSWRVILVSEAKYQGNDVNNITRGIRTPKMAEKNQYIMPAGNAIERVYKNIQEIKNFMISERHFPYVVFLQGSNFATELKTLIWPENGRSIQISPHDSFVNRIDRVTASNYGMNINVNLCRNIFINVGYGQTMLQAASIYAQCDPFKPYQTAKILWEIVLTSLEVLADELPTP